MMHETSQQQTLSVRISPGLRNKLERIRELESTRTGQDVSLSDVAKKLLESGRYDRLEVVELLSNPTAALARIRRKADAGHGLNRAEWIVVCHFVRQGLEAFSTAISRSLPPTSIVAAVDAFQALIAERSGNGSVRNGVYLEALTAERTPSSELTDEAFHQLLDEVRQRVLAGDGNRFFLVGRSLCTYVEEESDASAVSIDQILRRHWEGLWLLAARCHYARTNAPVRDGVVMPCQTPPIAPITDGRYTASVVLGGDVEIIILLDFPEHRSLRYPLSGYPRISEFRAMMEALGDSAPAVGRWQGRFFVGDRVNNENADQVWFRCADRGNGVGFSAPEWLALRSLCEDAFAMPDVAIAWRRLARDYGQL
jgi:hypothetical protein